MSVGNGRQRQTVLRRRFDLTTLAGTRAAVRLSIVELGVAGDRVPAFIVAVGEAMNNAIRHGAGSGEITLHRDVDGCVVAEIRDRGHARPFAVPAVAPPADRPGGRGLWMASQLCDRIAIDTGEDGTAVTLELRVAS